MEPPKYIPSVALDAFERQDYELVLKLALPAAMDGNSDAQTTVALLYECGLGVNRDVLEAERWLLMAAERDNPVAWNNLGHCMPRRLLNLGIDGMPHKNATKEPRNSG